METVIDRNLTGCDVRNHLGDEEWRITRTEGLTCLCIVHGFLFECTNSSDAHAKDDTDFVFIYFFQIPSAVLDGFIGSNYCILLVKVHLTRFFAVEIVLSVIVLDFARKMCLELGCIEMCNLGSTAYSVLGILPSFLGILSKRSYGAYAGYNNSFQFHR